MEFDSFLFANRDPFGAVIVGETITLHTQGHAEEVRLRVYDDLEEEGRAVFDSLIRDNDEYFVLGDYASYVATQTRLGQDYQNKTAWTRKALVNIAASGEFSADYTVA
ncbi:glycogen/starch/alpha-glucan phosphorylase [Weissella confusa]|uniref:Alpha-1,4 glucan phosphorylase n=1 Tax=Weissella confusa TaxID=1583 RepID=A0A923SU00_WEICO|nr:glycogen/starch/alpha-glucan phosphorylase [Weissella confusa]